MGKPSFVPNKQGHGSLEIEGRQYCSMLCEDYLACRCYISSVSGILPDYNRTNSLYVIDAKSYTNSSYIKSVMQK